MPDVPCEDGFFLVMPVFDHAGLCGLCFEEIVEWRIEGADVDNGRLLPVVESDDINDVIAQGEIYAIQHPNGAFVFPDRERCNDDDVLESFRRRLAAR